MTHLIRQDSRSAAALRALPAILAMCTAATACGDRNESPTAPGVARATVSQATDAGATVTVLPNLGGGFTAAADINDVGQVVGWSIDGTATRRAFLWTETEGMKDLGTLGGTTSEATAINAAGQIVGFSETAAGRLHAFLWTPERGMQDLGTLGDAGSVARAINNRGEVVGYTFAQIGETFRYRALLWTPEQQLVELPTLGSAVTAAVAINNAGRVVINVATAAGEEHPFLWSQQHGMLDVGGLPQEATNGTAINESGRIVGVAIRQPDATPFIWSAHQGLRELGALNGPAVGLVSDINDAGQVAGSVSAMPGGRHAFVWSLARGTEDLYAATGMREARAINNRGQVVGGDRVATVR
jgi:probable HAF family extracellular repeat protein